MKALETISGMGQEQDAKTGSPISKVPNEILGLIFKELKRGDCFHKYAWWKVLLVSRRWKNVAHEDASLWANIPTHNHTGTLCMLKRSRTSLLDVRINDWTATAATVSAVLNHIHRIGQLAIGNGAWHKYDLEARLQEAGKAPSKLKVLSIDFFSYNQYVLGTPPLAPLRAQSLQHLVSLQELDFSLGVKYDWNIFPIPGLKVLSLTESTPTNPPTWAQFQRALHRMPVLEDVRFNFEDLSLTSAGPPHEAVISMLQLRTIFVGGGSLSVIGYFFSQTKLPALQDAIVHSNYDGSIENPALYEPAIRAVLSLLADSAFTSLDRMRIDSGGFKLITTTTLPDLWLEDGLTFACDCELPTTVMQMMLNHLATGLTNRASDVTHLALTTNTEPQDLSELLRMLSHLKSIDVAAEGHDALLESLSAHLALPQAGDAPASSVEEMTVGTRFSAYDSQVTAGSLAHRLRDCLASRQQSGFTLRKLILCGKFTAEHVKMFRGIVGEVKRRKAHPTLSVALSSSEYTTDED